MSENTKIEWCDHTFNPWTGCMKVSPACDHCYAEGWSKRAGEKVGKWGPGAPRVRTTPANWNLPKRWNVQADAFMAQRGRRQRVFCASLADVFDNAVEPQWRADLFDLIASTPALDWLLLTKRIGNAWKMMADACGVSVASARLPLPNVWLGATIVNQEEADRDIPKLLAVPACVRFLSMEPLLGQVNLAKLNNPGPLHQSGAFINALRGGTWGEVPTTGERLRITHSPLDTVDWVIVGGESGPGARPMHPDWARSLSDQCRAAGVPFLFKQWGEWTDFDHTPSEWWNGRTEAERKKLEQRFVGGMAMNRIGKKAAGRLLDGRDWNEVPA